MSPDLRRLSRAVLAALTLGLVTGLLVAPQADAARAHTRTFRAHRLPASVDVANSLRGQYAWLGQPAQGASRASDTYYRDQVRWGAIEPSPGTFDLSGFDAGLAGAASKGGRFGFRVMAWCPSCWTETRTDVPHTTPAWLPLQPGTSVPDWNSETFLAGWEDLMRHLGARYGNDPRLGWVDVGGYGAYGEWHTNGQGTPATDASMTRIIRAVVANFPRAHVVVNAMDQRGTAIAMAMSPRIGLRTDCLGAPDMYSLIASSKALQQRWRTAPVISEWCHAPVTSTVLGAQQVRRFHVSAVSSGNTPATYAAMTGAQRAGWDAAVRTAGYRYQLRSLSVPRRVRPGHRFAVRLSIANLGSAPTYDPWRVQVRLVDRRGHVAAVVPLRGDLRRLLRGTRTFRGSVAHVARGGYRLEVAVTDPTGYLSPMALANPGRSATGGYALGRVRVG